MNAMPSIRNESINRWARSSWIRAALLAAALGGTAAALPSKAQAADVQVRVLVDVADLIFRSGRPYYYERGHYHPVVVEYDRWRRPSYYRYAPRPVVYYPAPVVYRPAPPPPRYHYGAPHRHDVSPHYRASYRDRGHGHDRGRGHDRDKHRGRGWKD